MKKIILWVASLAGLLLFIFFYEATFPTASLDLKVDRTEALKQARQYLTELGYDASGYQTSVVFSGDRTKFVFIEKCLGLKKTNEVTKKDIPIWYWEVRFFKELKKEAFEVYVNPIGRVDGFNHFLEDNEPGMTLEQTQAEEKAIAFLHTQGIPVDTFERIQASSVKRENRIDHSFTWKNNESELTWAHEDSEGTGMIRVSVDVYGDKIGRFRTFFWVPEVFERYMRKLFSEGNFLALTSSFFYMILYICAIVMFISSFRERGISFRMLLTLGLLIGIPNILSVINAIPIIKAGYDTKITFLVYYGSQFISEIKGIVNHIVIIIIMFCGGIFLADKLYGKQIEGMQQLLQNGKPGPRTRSELLYGYNFAFIVLGFVTVFYYCGMKYAGVWVFPSTRYSNILGTWFPFLLPLSMSLVAAISEEFIFRLFAISFLKKMFRFTILAALIPSVIWAFAHSSYAVFPIYTRGIELTIVALAFSFVFLRYSILTCIVAHYVIDAVLFSLPLLRSSNTYFLVSGVIVILLAFLPAVIGLRVKEVKT